MNKLDEIRTSSVVSKRVRREQLPTFWLCVFASVQYALYLQKQNSFYDHMHGNHRIHNKSGLVT